MTSSRPTFNSAAEVESAFYEALARSDLDTMMDLWSEDEEVVCVHPDGPRWVGLNAIRESWRRLFTGGARLIVRTSHQVISNSMLLTVHNVLEHVAIEGDDQLHPPMVATNAYVRGPTGWRMVLHHASPASEALAMGSTNGNPRMMH